jgi:hypothetical protein
MAIEIVDFPIKNGDELNSNHSNPRVSVPAPGDLLEKRQWRIHRGSPTGPRGLPREQHVPWLRVSPSVIWDQHTCRL